MRQPTATVRAPRGFTLIEVLVAVAILGVITALALPAILLSRKRGIETRVRSDLALISTALAAYKDDFGDYPRFSTPAEDQAAIALGYPLNSASYPWIDGRNGDRGAVLLCRALIGPGPGPVASAATAAPPAELQGEDGADGPGFRTRRTLSAINNIWVTTGKVSGPYLDASKFKLVKSYPPTDVDGMQCIADSSGHPILYYPAAPTHPVIGPNPNVPSSHGFDFPADPTYRGADMPMYNIFDNQLYLPAPSAATWPPPAATGVQILLGDTDGNGYINSATPAEHATTTEPFLLWTAGVDGTFGLANGKTDDIANFDMPANLRK